MSGKRIILGNGISKGKRENIHEPSRSNQKEAEFHKPVNDYEKQPEHLEQPIPSDEPEQSVQPEQIPLDENVWGNDYRIINKLSEKQLADRRLYVRIRHIQKIECNRIYENIEDEPILLSKPMDIITSDLSMGGIGIICDYELNIGGILGIQLTLDSIQYDIKCEVIYCIANDDKFRCGLKVVQKDKQFIKHLKIFIARLSLKNNYGLPN